MAGFLASRQSAAAGSAKGARPLRLLNLQITNGIRHAFRTPLGETGAAGIGGNFSLSYAGHAFQSTQTTGAIPYDAPAIGAGSMKEHLEALSNIGIVNVTRSTVSSSGGYTWSVTFGGCG